MLPDGIFMNTKEPFFSSALYHSKTMSGHKPDCTIALHPLKKVTSHRVPQELPIAPSCNSQNGSFLHTDLQFCWRRQQNR